LYFLRHKANPIQSASDIIHAPCKHAELNRQ
jgi:hypothetical protein